MSTSPSHFLASAKGRGVLYQVLTVTITVALGWYLIANTLHNLGVRGIATGFDFLEREAGFGISETLISYSAADSYLRALVVGLLNTIEVSVAGIVLATILGVTIGIARLSSNWLVARLATVYVETVRNIPLLLQLSVWYGGLMALPGPRASLSPLPHVFLSNRGLRLPSPAPDPSDPYVLSALAIGIVLAVVVWRWSVRRRAATGRSLPVLPLALLCVVAPPTVAFVTTGASFTLELPVLQGFNFVGGTTVTPEFTALLLGLGTYTAGFIAEIVRSGILSVPRGQTEAAQSLRLRPVQTLRLVILPQAMRVILPPLTSQYLNLIKNSSLAVAIGFPDLVSVTNTSANQTGQVVETVALMMAVYLTISLALAAFMNWYNTKVALVTR